MFVEAERRTEGFFCSIYNMSLLTSRSGISFSVLRASGVQLFLASFNAETRRSRSYTEKSDFPDRH